MVGLALGWAFPLKESSEVENLIRVFLVVFLLFAGRELNLIGWFLCSTESSHWRN